MIKDSADFLDALNKESVRYVPQAVEADAGTELGEPEEESEPFVDLGQLFCWELAEDLANASLVDGSDLVDQGPGSLAEPGVSGLEGWIERAFAGRPSNRDYSQQGISLIGCDRWAADDDTGPHPALLVAEHRIERDQDQAAAV